MAGFRDERECGLTNADLSKFAKKVKGPPQLQLGLITAATWLTVLGIIGYFALTGYTGQDSLWWIWFALMFVPLRRLLKEYVNVVGAKATALLAERGEERALPPLARIWNAWGKTPFVTRAGEQNFDRWLTEGYATASANLNRDLRGMARRAFPDWRRFHYRDFSDAATDTLLAALRCLAQSPMKENKATLRHVARFPLPPNAPNRALLREMAILFLDNPKPAVPLQRPVSAAVLPTPSILPTALAPPVSPEITEQTAARNRRI